MKPCNFGQRHVKKILDVNGFIGSEAADQMLKIQSRVSLEKLAVAIGQRHLLDVPGDRRGHHD